MDDDYGSDLSSFFEDPAEVPSMETLLATSMAANAEPPQQDPAATHVQPEPVAIPDVQVPVVDPANYMIPVQQVQPPAAQLEQYQQMPDEVQPAAGQSWFEQYMKIVGEVPPPTQFQQYQQMAGEVPPPTTPVHHEQILAELPPAAGQSWFEKYSQMVVDVPPSTQFQQYQQMAGKVPPAAMPFQDQQMPDEVPPAAMTYQEQHMLAELPPAAPSQGQQMPAEWPAAAMPSQDQQMLAEGPAAAMPSQEQQTLAELPPAAPFQEQQMLAEGPAAAMPSQEQQTLAELPPAAPFQEQQMLAEWPAAAMPSQDQTMLTELPPAQDQQLLADLPPAAMLGDSASAAMALEHQGTLGDSSWTLAYQNNYLDLDEDIDIDELFSLREDLVGDDSGRAIEDDIFSGGNSNLSASDLLDYVLPVDEPAVFVPISPEQLYCGTCNVFREVRHVNEGLGQFFSVHRDLNTGIFHHAIVGRGFPGADWRNPRHELLRLDLTRRTHAWVLRFIARGVETLRNQPGTVVDMVGADDAPGQGGSSSIADQAACNDDDAEINMLCELFVSIPAVNREAAAPAPAPVTTTATALENLSAPIGLWIEERAPEIIDATPETLESPPTPATGDAATLYPSVINRRQLEGRRAPGIDTMEEEEIRQQLRAAKERADEPFPSKLKKLCRNGGEIHKNKAHLIQSHKKKIGKNVTDSEMRYGKDLIKVAMDVRRLANCVDKMLAELSKELKSETGGDGDNGRCAPPGKNDDGSGGAGGSGAGPSAGGSAGGGGGAAVS